MLDRKGWTDVTSTKVTPASLHMVNVQRQRVQIVIDLFEVSLSVVKPMRGLILALSGDKIDSFDEKRETFITTKIGISTSSSYFTFTAFLTGQISQYEGTPKDEAPVEISFTLSLDKEIA